MESPLAGGAAAAQAPDASAAGLEEQEPALPTGLPADAYPRDEPMQSDMSEYRQAFPPNLSLQDRKLLNNVREDRMSSVAEEGLLTLAGCLARGQRLASSVAELLLRCCHELEEVAQQAAEQESGEAQPQLRPTRRPAVALSILRAATGWDLFIGSVVPAVSKFLDQHMATLNILMWICLLEMLHKIFSWFILLGWPSLTSMLQGVSAPFLLRLYYALVARMCGPEVRRPAFHAVRTMGASAAGGFARPGGMRPPVLQMVLVARVIMLIQVAYLSWVVTLQGSLASLQGAAAVGQPEAPPLNRCLADE